MIPIWKPTWESTLFVNTLHQMVQEEMEKDAGIDKSAYNQIFYIKDHTQKVHFDPVDNYLTFHGSSVKNIGIYTSTSGYMEIIKHIEKRGYNGNYILFGDLNRILMERRLNKNERKVFKTVAKRLKFIEFSTLSELRSKMETWKWLHYF